MSLFKMPYALLVGVLVAFTALIPIFGAFIGCVVGAFLILMVDPLQALFFVIMFLVLQQIEGNLIYPKVVGKFGRSAFHMGACGSNDRRQFDGRCGDADLYSVSVGCIYAV